MDLDNLFKRAFDGFGEPAEPPEFPGVPGSGEATGNGDAIDFVVISRRSRFSRSENRETGSEQELGLKKPGVFFGGDRANVSPKKPPGNTGTPGTEAKRPAESTLSQFPVKDREPGTPGTGNKPCERPILDLNRAAPQRSDWWTGPAMAEADALQAAPLPITPAEVCAGVERELRALDALGRSGPDALRDAIAITRAKIWNSEVLAERQAHDRFCHVCGEALDDTLPVISVMTGRPGAHLHLHSGCHVEHVQRRTVIVERIMAAAGYGSEEQAGLAREAQKR